MRTLFGFFLIMAQGKYTYDKKKKLKSKKAIERVFREGKVLKTFPLRGHFVIRIDHAESSIPPLLTGVSVPKRSFKKAIDRNSLKRKMREAFRLNQYLLVNTLKQKNMSMDLMIVYGAKEKMDYGIIEKSMRALLTKISTKILKEKGGIDT